MFACYIACALLEHARCMFACYIVYAACLHVTSCTLHVTARAVYVASCALTRTGGLDGGEPSFVYGLHSYGLHSYGLGGRDGGEPGFLDSSLIVFDAHCNIIATADYDHSPVLGGAIVHSGESPLSCRVCT